MHKAMTKKIELALSLMEARAKTILEREDNYSDLYIDPNVDIVNSSPQVIQQVKEEITDFLKLLLEKKTNNILQIGLGHFAATHFFSQPITQQGYHHRIR